jgi:type IV secretory pathway VirJ component
MDRADLSATGRAPRIAAVNWLVGIVTILAILVLGIAAAAGFFDTDPLSSFGMDGKHAPVAAVYMSGDMGLRFGMGHAVSTAMARRHIPVLGVNSATAFSSQRNQRDVDRLIAGATREAIARTGAGRIVLMGQSFGADVLAAGVDSLPAQLRARIAAIVLVVPARSAYFAADPTGIRYRGTPDANTVAPARAVDWAPIICIYGAQETDSLCPALSGTNARIQVLPGGHFLRNDHDLLIRTIFAGLGRIRPALW